MQNQEYIIKQTSDEDNENFNNGTIGLLTTWELYDRL